jgi:hypothetical protein
MTLQSGILKRTADAKQNTRALSTEYLLLGAALLVAVVHGLTYLFIMPPWQHYDEPGHFEYAWLIANRSGLPKPGDYDQSMRREVAISMAEHGFFRDLDFGPNLDAVDEPIWIGPSQLGDPYFYYLLVSIPLRFINSLDVTAQLYVGRFVSLILFLVTILAAWGVVREITSPGNLFRWVFPGTLALVSGFANFMTSVSNDVGAIAVFSLFLWGSIRLIKRGFSFLDFLWVLASATLCYFMKSTVYVALLLLPIVLLFGFLQGRWRKIAWFVLISGSLAGLVMVFSWGDAANWYRSTDQSGPTRIATSKAPLGDYTFYLESSANVSPTWHRPLFQPIPSDIVKRLAGKTVTLGAWIWASEPAKTNMPLINDGTKDFSRSVTVGTEPVFYALRAKISKNAGRMWVSLPPKLDSPGKGISIYYDGLILAEGERPIKRAPLVNDPGAGAGEWGGQPFVNLLRNASAEGGGLRIHPWLEKLAAKIFPSFSGPSFTLAYLLDWTGAKWHYVLAGGRLFRTFWGQFGWGQVPLLGHKPYRVILEFVIVGIMGFILALWRRRKYIPWAFAFLCGLALVGIWGGAVMRGLSHLSVTWLWLPVARYGYPAIIPTLLIPSIGWLEILRNLGRKLGIPRWGQLGIYFGLLIALDVWTLVSIIRFYS